MLDKLVLHIPFKEKYLRSFNSSQSERYVDLDKLPNNMYFSGDIHIINGTKKVSNLKTRFESLPSSYSGMAFKVYTDGTINYDPYVCLKCSPCKLLQGHNLYGFDDVKKAFENMTWLLIVSYPEFRNLLEFEKSIVSELDITYSIFVDKPNLKMAILDYMKGLSSGQTKAMGDSYQTTCYFGSKNSRIKKLKVYSKYEEMVYDLKKVEKNKFIDSAVIIKELLNTDFCKQAIRFEATVKKRFLERKDIPVLAIDLIKYIEENSNFYQYIFNDAWKDIFETFKGQEIEIMNDEVALNAIQKVYTSYTKSGKESLVKVNRLFHVYKMIETMGYDYAKSMSKKSMFYNNISDLKKCGFSKSTLQNLHKKSGEKIIPLKWYVNIDFSCQFPDNYEEVKNLWEI